MHRRRFLAGASATAAAVAARPGYSRTGVSKDMAIFRAAMNIHPGLYRYNSPQEIAARLDRLEADYDRDTSTAGRYLLLSRFLAGLKCGHSYCNFFNQSDPAVIALWSQKTRLPFHFEWLGSQMVVSQDYSGTNQLPAGTVIETINGITSATLLRQLMPLARADGHNDGKRLSILGVRGAETIEFFDVFQGLLFPPVDEMHAIEAQLPDGRRHSLKLPAQTLKDRQSSMTRVAEDSDQPRWTWTVREDGIAVLAMPGWAMWNSRWDWNAWLDARLDSLDNAKGLIIDVRMNEGGDDCGNPILSRLVDAPFPGFNFQERVRFETVPDILAPHVSTWNDNFKSIGLGGKLLGNGFIERPAKDAAAVIFPSEKRIKVAVAALIGPANSSATFAFADAAKRSGKIKLVGAETGGNRRGINGGGFFFTKLPESGVEFDLPLVGYFPYTQEPDQGIEPDVKVVQTAQDIAIGRDPVMNAAVNWLVGK